MKSVDFMIGDIVMAHYDDGETQCCFPAIVIATFVDRLLCDDGVQIKSISSEYSGLCDEECVNIEPIPLTEEIFENNGFEVTKESKMLGLTIAACYELNNEAEYPNKYWISIDNFSDDEKIRMSFDIQYPKKIHQLSGLDIAYVHELQHALRVCGLCELADNFKI